MHWYYAEISPRNVLLSFPVVGAMAHHEEDGHVGSDDDDGGDSKVQRQDEEYVDVVVYAGPDSPPGSASIPMEVSNIFRNF